MIEITLSDGTKLQISQWRKVQVSGTAVIQNPEPADKPAAKPKKKRKKAKRKKPTVPVIAAEAVGDAPIKPKKNAKE